MLADDPLMLDLAGAILDGGVPDWPSLESTATDSQRATFAELQAVAAIASLRWRPPVLPLSTPVLPLEGLSTWGQLRILEPVGHGGFGTVYRAWDPQLDREVALKLLPATDDGVNALEEGRLLARVHHPNVVTIFGADRVGPHVGLWMEYVRGQTLERLVASEGPVSAARAAAIGRHVCEALDAVHRAGLVHGDVKAHNVMIDSGGRPVLMDFGAGRLAGAAAQDVAGTPIYMAPEIFTGGPATPLSDQYSAGVLLYYLLTGRYPVSGRTLGEVRETHGRKTERVPLRSLRPNVPRRLAAAIDRALAVEPATRFPSAAAFAEALATVNAGVLARRPARLALAGAVVTAGVAVAIATVPGLPFRRQPPASALGAVALPPGTPTAKRLTLPDVQLAGNGLSRDGRYYSYLDGSGLAVYEMATGTSATLVPPDGEQFAEFSITSPDGAHVAYQWWTARGCYEIRVVDRVSRSVRTLVRDDSLDQLLPVEWSRDGSSIVLWTKSLTGVGRIAIADVASGHVEIVREVAGDPLGISLSPDERWVAYDLPIGGGSAARALHVVDRRDGTDHRLPTTPAANDRHPLWTPDGRRLFFLSDRSGSSDGWVVTVHQGVGEGEPLLAVRNLGRVSSLGLTDTGLFYYRLAAGAFEVKEVELDPATGALASTSRSVASRFAASNIGPAYAPDGRRMSFISVRDALGGVAARTIVIKDLATGHEREINPPFTVGNRPARWASDGRRLLVGSRILDAGTGQLLHAFNEHATRDTSSYGPVHWSADGGSVIYEREGVGLVRHFLNGAPNVPVYEYTRDSSVARIHRFEISPDGRRIAFSANLRDRQGMALRVLSADGELELGRYASPEGVVVQGWSPDGHYVLFTTIRFNERPPHALWRVPSTGGTVERLGAVNGATQNNPMAISPSGRAVAFTSGTPLSELWLMEHFLPE